jgi:uncharacterized membrane protein YgcG
MNRAGRRIRHVLLLLPIILALAASASLALLAGHAAAAPATRSLSAIAENGCIGPTPGQHIYDCANLLTSQEIANLEADAAAVEQAGAPTVVYLQVRNATAQQTLQDAIDLMNRWNVESRAGAHDGFVMFFNLQPGNLRHGQVALYAGARHSQGNLPVSELTRIRTDVMTPLLQDGQTAAGIAAGLQMVAHDLRYGPPPPPAYRTVAAALGRIPFGLLALLFAGAVALAVVRLGRQAPLSSTRDVFGESESPATPGDLSPAMAGALVRGRVGDAQIEATILDFARRGLLVIEPAGTRKVMLQLQGPAQGLTGYEQDTWNSLVRLADGERGTISSAELAHLRQDWGAVKTELRRELVERGWYDPTTAAARRRPLYILGALGIVGLAVGVVLIVLSQEGWAAIGLVIVASAGTFAFIRGYAVHDTTVEGELAAARWRAYRALMTTGTYEPNLDTDLPYIVALGIVGKLTPRIKAASERGYSPSWFRAPTREGQVMPAMGFYPYWIAFHASAAPTSSGSATGGYSGGGAASGGGGSAGGF